MGGCWSRATEELETGKNECNYQYSRFLKRF